MKMITEKQKKFINDIKGVITENGINAIDALDLNKFTCYDASKLIGGLLGLRLHHQRGAAKEWSKDYSRGSSGFG